MPIKNYFVAAAGLLYIAGAFSEIVAGRYPLAIIFACYAVANFVLAVI